jgi:anti-anti-sigma factor
MAANPITCATDLLPVPRKKRSETMVFVNRPITTATAPALVHDFLDLIQRFERVILDLSGIEHIDSFGVAILANLYMQARRSGCDLEIANAKPRLRERFRRWLDSVFEGHEELLGVTPD